MSPAPSRMKARELARRPQRQAEDCCAQFKQRAYDFLVGLEETR